MLPVMYDVYRSRAGVSPLRSPRALAGIMTELTVTTLFRLLYSYPDRVSPRGLAGMVADRVKGEA